MLALLGGIWLSLIYAAMVPPASVWAIQVSVSRGLRDGFLASAGLASGQLPWALLAGALLFEFPRFWQSADLALRLLATAFLLWLAYRSGRARPVKSLRLVVTGSGWNLLWASFLRSLLMPWRLPLWACLVVAMSVHLRGPGWPAALPFAAGCLLGQLGWLLHFVIIGVLFGERVPEDISLRSMNKLRFLATVVPAGLCLVCLAPLSIK